MLRVLVIILGVVLIVMGVDLSTLFVLGLIAFFIQKKSLQSKGAESTVIKVVQEENLKSEIEWITAESEKRKQRSSSNDYSSSAYAETHHNLDTYYSHTGVYPWSVFYND